MNSVPAQSLARSELQALVCGASFTSFESASPYISTGLIHLFVVSGAHLVFLQKILDLFFKKLVPEKIYFILSASALFLFTAACEFNPPITRALIAFALTAFLNSKKTYWPPHFKILIVGFISLCFEPAWLGSISLQLSWLIALGLNLNSTSFKNSHFFLKQLLLYVLIFPTLIYFQVPQFYIIFINLLLTPVLEFILFPLGLVVLFFNFLYFLFDEAIALLKILLSFFEIKYQFQLLNRPDCFIISNWAFILLIHLLIHLAHLKNRKSAT